MLSVTLVPRSLVNGVKTILIWSGQPEAFSHFVHEVKWTLSSSKEEERALLAARIVRKALQSGQPTLVQLMYKLKPDDFSGEQDAQKLIRFLEDSPLNRQVVRLANGGFRRRRPSSSREQLKNSWLGLLLPHCRTVENLLLFGRFAAICNQRSQTPVADWA